jgi:hypothetical protein
VLLFMDNLNAIMKQLKVYLPHTSTVLNGVVMSHSFLPGQRASSTLPSADGGD